MKAETLFRVMHSRDGCGHPAFYLTSPLSVGEVLGPQVIRLDGTRPNVDDGSGVTGDPIVCGSCGDASVAWADVAAAEYVIGANFQHLREATGESVKAALVSSLTRRDLVVLTIDDAIDGDEFDRIVECFKTALPGIPLAILIPGVTLRVERGIARVEPNDTTVKPADAGGR